jgi:hypothetical protein
MGHDKYMDAEEYLDVIGCELLLEFDYPALNIDCACILIILVISSEHNICARYQ